MSIDDYLRRLELKRLLLGCPWWDIRVCCSRDLHRKHWYYRNGRFYCAICERLRWIA
jgi:hypothetical protein